MDNEKRDRLSALVARGDALKASLGNVANRPGHPSMVLAAAFNQMIAETAEAIPDLKDILPPPLTPLPDGEAFSSASYFDLLVYNDQIIAVITDYLNGVH
jgi:hypothetical protein